MSAFLGFAHVASRDLLRAGFFGLIAAVAIATGAFAADSKGPNAGLDFAPSTITCLEYTNGLGENSATRLQSEIARIWMLGYMAGYFKAQKTIEFTDDKDEGAKITNLLLQRCRENPAASVLVVTMKALTQEPHKLPRIVTSDFAPDSYTCGQHVDSKTGSANAANRADLAELWAFGFIQGYKNVTQPDTELPATSKAQLTGAVNKSCATNRNTLYMDLTALVADKVKLAG